MRINPQFARRVLSPAVIAGRMIVLAGEVGAELSAALGVGGHLVFEVNIFS